MDWVNGHYIRALAVEDLAERIKPYLVEKGYIAEDIDQERLVLITSTFQESISKLSDVVEQSAFLFEDIVITEEDAKEMASGEQVPELAKAFINELNQVECGNQIAIQTQNELFKLINIGE